MKSHTMIVKTLLEHNNDYFAVMGTENILCKFGFDQIIFLDFTGFGSLKYKEIRVSGAKLF